jgi:glycosyltransferase involved in cell wall biosynthesis
MKHIVILVDQLYCHGGIERLVVIKANYWSVVRGYKVTVVGTEQKCNKFAFELSPKVAFIDLEINYNRKISYFSSENLIKFYRNVRYLKRLFRKVQPDFIIVASHIPITYCINFFKGNAVTAKEIHFTQFFRQKNWKSRIERILLSTYDHLIVLSKEEATFCETSNVVVLPNPCQEFPRDLEIKRPSNKKNKALFLGRIATVKNLEDMLLIWSQFVKMNPDWVLEIYGNTDNDYGTEIKTLAKQYSLSHQLVFKEATNTSADAINDCKLMLLTSHEECFPLVILESLALGVPVFAYDCPTGPRNILTHNLDGKLIQNKNIDAFVAALHSFAQNLAVQDAMHKNAFITAQKYTLETIMNSWDTKIFT